jgi:hypothetical protein
MARTASGDTPDFLSSPIESELVALALTEYADIISQRALESDTSRVNDVLVRTYRRASGQITKTHVEAGQAAA